MTSAEWQDAFRRGDPESIGKAVLRAIHEAYGNRVTGTTPDIGQLAPGHGGSDADDLQFCIQVGQVMREYGLLYQLPPDVPALPQEK